MVDNSITLKLPSVPDNFCFKETEFEYDCDEFEDQFIKRHQNDMPLEKIREDLSIYLRKLRLSLVDLINSDYEEFINLTVNYIDLNNNINNLTYCLNKLKDDIKQNQQQIQSTIDKLNQNLNSIHQIIKQKNNLNFILNSSKIIDYLEQDLDNLQENQKTNELDQNFIKINYQLNLINLKLKKLNINSSYVNNTFKNKLNYLNIELDNYLNNKLDEFIENENVNGLNEILECAILNEQTDQLIELIYQKVFHLKLQEFICGLNIDRLGILKFYDQLFEICDNGLKLFRNLDKLNLIDYLCDRIYYNLTINASTLFLAGEPDKFIFNYKETIKFFNKLLNTNLNSFKIYSKLKSKFNFEIYFLIRSTEISKELSKSLENPIQLFNQQQQQLNQLSNNQNQLQIKFQLIDDLLKILNYIWSDAIYLDTLFYDFWRLTLLLISRYTLFLNRFKFENYFNQSLDYQLQSTILICIINQSSLLINSIQQLYTNIIKNKIPNKQINEYELTNCLNQSFDTLIVFGLPSINLKQVFCIQCSTILNQIKEIPRLYRKTNRDKPTKPSTYILNCIELFQQLKQIQKYSTNLILDILNEITNTFFNLVSEVLESLQKMEESLMRLKKVQQTSNGNLNNKNLDKKTTITDADKIRLQFKLDVNYYLTNGIGSFNLDKNKLINLDALNKLVGNF